MFSSFKRSHHVILGCCSFFWQGDTRSLIVSVGEQLSNWALVIVSVGEQSSNWALVIVPVGEQSSNWAAPSTRYFNIQSVGAANDYFPSFTTL
jgi:hypothetical protein